MAPRPRHSIPSWVSDLPVRQIVAKFNFLSNGIVKIRFFIVKISKYNEKKLFLGGGRGFLLGRGRQPVLTGPG